MLLEKLFHIVYKQRGQWKICPLQLFKREWLQSPMTEIIAFVGTVIHDPAFQIKLNVCVFSPNLKGLTSWYNILQRKVYLSNKYKSEKIAPMLSSAWLCVEARTNSASSMEDKWQDFQMFSCYGKLVRCGKRWWSNILLGNFKI